jgi:hypothetical protein
LEEQSQIGDRRHFWGRVESVDFRRFLSIISHKFAFAGAHMAASWLFPTLSGAAGKKTAAPARNPLQPNVYFCAFVRFDFFRFCGSTRPAGGLVGSPRTLLPVGRGTSGSSIKRFLNTIIYRAA